MGKVMQLFFAVFMPRQVVPNLASAGIAANSASGSADLLTDLKSGYLLGANPRKQFLAQFIGIFFGTLAIVPAWYLMIPNVEALEKYPLPATRTWEAVARVLSQGLEALPMSARWAAFAGALIGILLPVIEHLAPKARKWMPSAMGIGLGWVVFFSNALAFTIGAADCLGVEPARSANAGHLQHPDRVRAGRRRVDGQGVHRHGGDRARVVWIGWLRRSVGARSRAQNIPSWSFAASDMRSRVHGGSQTTSTFTSATPGTAATAFLTCPGRNCAAGHAGAVSVIRMPTTFVASTMMS